MQSITLRHESIMQASDRTRTDNLRITGALRYADCATEALYTYYNIQLLKSQIKI